MRNTSGDSGAGWCDGARYERCEADGVAEKGVPFDSLRSLRAGFLTSLPAVAALKMTLVNGEWKRQSPLGEWAKVGVGVAFFCVRSGLKK